MKITEEIVKTTLFELKHPLDDSILIETTNITKIESDGLKILVHLTFGYPLKSIEDSIRDNVVSTLMSLQGVKTVKVEIEFSIAPHVVQRNLGLLPQIKNVIAVASGKGGVGKSTVSVNLALALSAEGARVGILDADIYGPSQQKMLGLTGKPESPDGKKINPMVKFNLQVMSIGLLVEEDTPMVWRGPMVTSALEQLLRDTEWKDLDYLVVDLPPGTGDIQLTLSQKVPLTGAVIVTTPQDISLIDARKALKMFEKVGVPILGILENMSVHLCEKCGHEETIFGEGGGQKMSSEYNINFLGKLPLKGSIRAQTDSGCPTVVADPKSEVATKYRHVALKTAMKVAHLSKHKKNIFPKIVVQKS